MKNRAPLMYFACVLALCAGLFLTHPAEGPAPVSVPPALAAEPAELPPLEGTWSGSWTDTLYDVTGSMTVEIVQDGDSWSATGSIDVTEIGIGGLGVLNGSASGTSDGVTITGTFDCANLGSGTATIGGALKVNGQVQAAASGSGTVGAPMNFGPFVFSGTVANGVMWGIFDFTGAGGGEGRAVLENPALPAATRTWGDLKAEYRDD
jgi:hypothetical protein